MREITKILEFVANDKINLELRKGEIMHLVKMELNQPWWILKRRTKTNQDSLCLVVF